MICCLDMRFNWVFELQIALIITKHFINFIRGYKFPLASNNLFRHSFHDVLNGLNATLLGDVRHPLHSDKSNHHDAD
jgi:hypothetical protein